jgi:hypothetical protein
VNRVEPAGFPTTTEYISGNINTYYLMATEMENIFKNNGNSISLFLHRVIIFTKWFKLRRDFGRRHNRYYREGCRKEALRQPEVERGDRLTSF